MAFQDDGSFGPSVFDSNYWPSRQYYLDSAVAARSSAQSLNSDKPDATRGPIKNEVVYRMWNSAQAIRRTLLIVERDRAFAPEVVPDAIIAASGAD